ncbi:endonuclease/exonuclease/phosphatase family protein [Nocardia sp. NPDC057663]|uniref:endonuclease/exonuclease/phosphatase family protein n=1 Tax=Nocardia sp. NPDC057663 TaxID=3346201 RepID=UPI00366E8E4F
MFDVIEVRQPVAPPNPGQLIESITIGAWNLERCKFVNATAKVIRALQLDVVLISEVDIGMARSGNLNTIRTLASLLGFGYAFCAEFVEIGIGDQTESVAYADERNSHSLHGNAILSRFPMQNLNIVLAGRQGNWFDLDWHHRRIGGRRVLLADIVISSGSLRVASAHLESLYTPLKRQDEVTALMEGMSPAGLPDIFGGDLNTNGVPPSDDTTEPVMRFNPWLRSVQEYEPMFTVAQRFGYNWTTSNTSAHTRRTKPNGWPAKPHRRCDWLLVRSGIEASCPFVAPAVNSAGYPVSDHELIGAEIKVHR